MECCVVPMPNTPIFQSSITTSDSLQSKRLEELSARGRASLIDHPQLLRRMVDALVDKAKGS
jgi:hypothetical protein